jgi:steroid delta-isomerase-like uncharacterized protein
VRHDCAVPQDNTSQNIALALAVFDGWSSGNADSNEAYFHHDAVLYDVVAGRHVGWPAIRTFFADGLLHWPDLRFDIDQVWTNDRGVALDWVMSATVTDARFGPEHQGKRWAIDGMSLVDIDRGKIRYEVDHWNRDQMLESLGIKKA